MTLCTLNRLDYSNILLSFNSHFATSVKKVVTV